jgi:hypothetical protein
MDKELHCDCDFVLEDKMNDIKRMDYSSLSHFKKEVENVTFIKRPLYWQKEVLSLLKEDYSCYIMTEEVVCVSIWVMVWLARLKRGEIYFCPYGCYRRES